MISFNFNKKRKLMDSAYKRVFNTHDGRLILQDMMEQHGVLNSVFDANPSIMALREGERNVVLRILSLIDCSSNEILKKIKEHSDTNAGFYMEEKDGGYEE